MSCEKHYIDTIGIVIRVDVVEDITTATDPKLYVRKPDGTEVIWIPSKSGTTHFEYTTVSGDVDQSGFYRLQAGFTIDGWTGRGGTAEFTIYPKFG